MDDPSDPKHPVTPYDDIEDHLWTRDKETDLKSLAEEYSSRGAVFPWDQVRQTLLDGWRQKLRAASDYREIPLPLPDFKITIGRAAETINCLIVADKFIARNEKIWKDRYPDLSDGLAWVTKELRTQVLAAKESEELADSLAFAFEPNDWIVDPATETVKAAMVEGAGNRPRELKNHVVCELYDCLREPFNEGWSRFAGTKNPTLLREHISRLLAPLFPPQFLADKPVDPKPHGPIWQAIQNHLK